MKVCIALCVGSHLISGGLLDPEGRIVRDIHFSHSSGDLSEQCLSSTQDAIDVCKTNKFDPIAICIATKGNVESGAVTMHPGDQRKIYLKQTLERNFNLPTYILNRFHAFSLGAYHFWGGHSESFGAINLSDGVGYGVVRSGEVLQIYDPRKGAGGLSSIRRQSDGKIMQIAKIAGSRAIEQEASRFIYSGCSVRKLFELTASNRNARKIIGDVADATAELVHDLVVSFHPLRIVAMVYGKENVAQENVSYFLGHIEKRLKSRNNITLSIEPINKISEERVKLIGVTKFAMQSAQLLMSVPVVQPIMSSSGDNIFVITGEPASGKTTFLEKVILTKLLENGVKVGGIFSQEVRDYRRRRIGFVMNTLSSSEPRQSFELAALKGSKSFDANDWIPFHGTPFIVNLKNIEESVVPILKRVTDDNEVIIIDEVAGMQLFSKEFKKTVEEIIRSQKSVIVTVPISGRDNLIQTIKKGAARHNSLFTLRAADRHKSQMSAYEVLYPKLIESIHKNREALGRKSLLGIDSKIRKTPDSRNDSEFISKKARN